MSDYLKKREREKRLEKIRGKAKNGNGSRRGPKATPRAEIRRVALAMVAAGDVPTTGRGYSARLGRTPELEALQEADVTQFAENIAHELDHDEWLDDPDHAVWEIAMAEADKAGMVW